MSLVSKERVFVEMRAILAAEAAWICSIFGEDSFAKPELAAAARAAERGDLKSVGGALERTEIGYHLSEAYSYAFDPQPHHTKDVIEPLVTSLLDFLRPAYAQGQINIRYLQEVPEHCDRLLEAVVARYTLDHTDADLMIPQIALLADMSEGSVRNASRAEGEARLETYNDGKRTYVPHAEALRWLKGRRGYRPTPLEKADPVGAGDIQAAQSTGELGALLTRLRTHQNRSESDLASELSWSLEKLRAWECGTFEFGVEDSKSLAKALGLDPVVFVPKAVELALRRDA